MLKWKRTSQNLEKVLNCTFFILNDVFPASNGALMHQRSKLHLCAHVLPQEKDMLLCSKCSEWNCLRGLLLRAAPANCYVEVTSGAEDHQRALSLIVVSPYTQAPSARLEEKIPPTIVSFLEQTKLSKHQKMRGCYRNMRAVG